MQKVTVYQASTGIPIEIVYREDADLWAEQQAADGRWGSPDEFHYEVTDFDNDTELRGIIISNIAPPNPTEESLWLCRSSGVLYNWSTETSKWVSVDRASFVPEDKLHSTHT